MQYTETTAAAAVLHFAENVFPGLFKGERNGLNKDYKRAYSIIRAAKAGTVTDDRAKALLEKYGGGLYRVTVRFEIAATNGNGEQFKAGLEKIWAIPDGE